MISGICAHPHHRSSRSGNIEGVAITDIVDMRGRGNAVRGTPSQADREESLSDDTVSGVRRLKGAPIGPTATSKHELPVFRSSFLASRRGASVLLKTHPVFTPLLRRLRNGLENDSSN